MTLLKIFICLLFCMLCNASENNGKLPEDFKFQRCDAIDEADCPRNTFMKQWKEFHEDNNTIHITDAQHIEIQIDNKGIKIETDKPSRK